MEFTLTERTEPLTLKEVLDFIDDTNISKRDAHELKSRIVDVVLDSEDRAIDEFVEKLATNVESFEGIVNGIRASLMTEDYFHEYVWEIAEQMKGVQNEG